MIQNHDKFSKQNIKYQKIYTFWKLIFIQQWLTQNMWFIGTTMCTFNNKLQKKSFKNSFMWKNGKDSKRIHNPFVR